GGRHAGPILVGVQDSFYGQARLSGGSANGRQEQLPGTQRRAGAIATDEAEQAVLDRIPFAGARREVTHGDLESQPIAQHGLKSPVSSFFFVSTLMIGCPAAVKLATCSSMWVNWTSRSG